MVSKNESDAHWQQNDYKGFAPNVDWDIVDFKKSPAIQELPVISAICEPLEGQTIKVKNDKIKVKGEFSISFFFHVAKLEVSSALVLLFDLYMFQKYRYMP